MSRTSILILAVGLFATACGSAGSSSNTDPAPSSSAPATTTASATTALPPATTLAPTTTSTPGTITEPGPSAADLCSATSSSVGGEIVSADLVEASGLVASRIHAGVLWSHNDSGSEGGVFAIGPTGDDLGFFPLRGVEAVDIEDMAMGAGGELLLADFGDNAEGRATILIYRFAEPTPGQPGPVADVDVLEFVFPDRPHNAETLLFDDSSGGIVIITKEQAGEPGDPLGATETWELFEGSLEGGGAGPVELVAVGTVDGPALEEASNAPLHPSALLGFGGVATGGDTSPDGRVIAVRTYATVWVWPRHPDQTVAEALQGEPCEPISATEAQGEAIALTSNGFVTLGEGANQPLNRIETG